MIKKRKKTMNLATEVSKYETKGFSRERSEVIVLMQQAAGAVFRDFPESFVLFGGATLILFHDGVRHSADLDLLSRTDELPPPDAIVESIRRGIESSADALELSPLEFASDRVGNNQIHVAVNSGSGERLFRVDLSHLGSVISSQIEEHSIDIGTGVVPTIRSASKHFLLLQKAEAFLLRRRVRISDAYDAYFLMSAGAQLNEVLTAHLSDALMNFEMDAEAIRFRIGAVDANHCRLELKPILPSEVYDPLGRADFQPLRDSLESLYAPWL